MSALRLEQGPTLVADLFRPLPATPPDARYVGSGKAAMALIFGHLKAKGILPHKMTPIVMPPWLGTWVYVQALSFGFPVVDPTSPSPVLFVYHQYGFPQDMDAVLAQASDRKMTVIEDCAHAADSAYRGRQLGTLGDYALFSYSKFAFCFALGGVQSADPDFARFVDERVRHGSRISRALINGFKLIDEWNSDREKPLAPSFFYGLRNMAYARYGDQPLPGRRAVRLWASKRKAEFAARRENYRLLRAAVDGYGICDHLESDGVSPYAVPLLMDEARALRAADRLRAAGIAAGLYQFDINRNLFEPAYRRCVLVPIHGGMTGAGMERLLGTLKSTL